jgi:hypothetical protein
LAGTSRGDVASTPVRNHSLQTPPWGLIFRQFADRLEHRFQVLDVEMIAMPAGNSDGVEHVLVATGQNLEQNEIFGAWKRQKDTEEFVATGSPEGSLFKWERCRDQVDLKRAPAETQRSRRRESLSLDRRLQFETGTSRQPDQCFRLGRGEENNRIGIGSRTGLTDGDDREPADDKIANTLLLEKREGEPAEGIEAAC